MRRNVPGELKRIGGERGEKNQSNLDIVTKKKKKKH